MENLFTVHILQNQLFFLIIYFPKLIPVQFCLNQNSFVPLLKYYLYQKQRSSRSPVILMVSYFNHFGNCVPLRFVYDFGARHGGHFTLLLFIPSYKFSFTLSIRIFLILSSPKIFFRGFFEKIFFSRNFFLKKKKILEKKFSEILKLNKILLL